MDASSEALKKHSLTCPRCGQTIVLAEGKLPAEVRCSACQGIFTPAGQTVSFQHETPPPTLPASSTPEPFPALPGYEIVDIIGQGGMGIVYRARDKRLQRLVAIKMIRTAAAGQADALARFRREAEAIARLKHPNIVQVFTIDESPSGPFLVMELVPGGSLASRVKGVPQEGRLAAGLVQSLASAVQAAHEHGILHRDLKPGNVLLAPVVSNPSSVAADVLAKTSTGSRIPEYGVPKIADFGLAKDIHDGLDQTLTAGVVGTPSYMAPEQAERGARQVGPAADIYALGAILYELLTGQPPFRGASLLDTLDQVRHQEPVPLTRLQPRTPRDLEVICLKCLEKEPGKRYASAEMLAEDLGRYLEGRPIRARPSGRLEKTWKWARRHPARAALVALSAATVLAAFAAVMWDNVRAQQYLASLKEENDKTEEARKQAVESAALAKVREKDAEERRIEAERQRRQAIDKTIRLTLATGRKFQAEQDWMTAMLYYAEAAALEDADSPETRKHRLRLSACLQQCPKLVQLRFHRAPVRHVEFSPDASRAISASADGTARVWDTATGKDLFSQPLAHQGSINHAVFSPDGQRILTGSEDGTARLWDARSGESLGAPFKHKAPVIQVAFSPAGDGKLLTVAGNRYVVGSYGNPAPTFRQQRIVTGVGPGGIPRYTTITVPTSSGAAPQNPRGLAQIWSDPTKPLHSFSHMGWINHAEFRPDGVMLATANCSIDKTNGVRIIPLEGVANAKPPLLRHGLPVLHVAFSPDGRRLIAACGKLETNLGEARIWDIDSNEQVGAVLKHQGMVLQARFSPNGKIVVTASTDGSARVWDAETGNPLTDPLRHRDRLTGAWFSPDGRRVLTAGQDGMVRLWDAVTGAPVGTALTHGSTVTAVAFHPYAPLILSGCQDGTVRLWDLATAALGELALKTREVLPPVSIVMSTAYSGTRSLRTQKTLPGRIATSVAFTSDGNSVLASSGARFVDLLPGGGQAQSVSGFKTTDLCIWDIGTGRLRFAPLRHALPISSGWISSQGHFAALRQADGDPKIKVSGGVDILAISSGNALHRFQLPPDEEIKDLRFLPEGKAYLLTFKKAGKEKTGAEVKAYDVQSGSLLMPPLAVSGTLEHACFSGDGRRLTVLTRAVVPESRVLQWSARVWDVRDPPQAVGAAVKLTHAVNEVVLNQDGSGAVAYHTGALPGFSSPGLAAPVQETEAYCWQVDSGKPMSLKHKGAIHYAGFSAEGRHVITCSADHTARVWDAITGKPLSAPLEHRGPVYHADIRPDGVVATAAADHASLWDLTTGELLSPPLKHHDWVIQASFRADGRRLATAGCDGAIRIWDLSLPSWPMGDWRKLVQLISGQRLDATQGVVPLSPAALAEAWNDVRARRSELFQSSAKHIAAWHEDELELALKDRDPRAALVHLEPLTRAAPERVSFWLLRGKALAQIQRLAQASESFAVAKKLDPQLLDACYALTLLLAALGKKDEARWNAEYLLQHFATSQGAVEASSALRAALVSDSGLQSDLLPAAEKLAAGKSPPSNATAILGAALFRAGRMDDAIQKLTLAGKTASHGERSWVFFFQAMAYHRKGNREEARRSWQTAIEAVDSLAAADNRRPPLAWTLFLELDLLRREAERLLGESKAN